MALLVAGFSAFPGAPENPTEALMEALGGMRTANGLLVRTMVLPVEWEGAFPPLAAAIDRQRPQAVLIFGLHAGAERIRLELVGHNGRAGDRADAAGAFASGPILAGGPAERLARLPLDGITARLRTAGIDVELSRDPGRYLCNDSLYRLCGHAPEAGVAAYGFVHVPLTEEALPGWAAAGVLPPRGCPFPAARLELAARAICEAVAESVGAVAADAG